MIKMQTLDDLSEFENKRIILFGAGVLGKSLCDILLSLNYNVVAFCVDTSEIWGTKVQGMPVVSPAELKEIARDDDVIVLLCVFVDTEVRKRLSEYLAEDAVKIAKTPVGMIQNSFFAAHLFQKLRKGNTLSQSTQAYYNELIARTKTVVSGFFAQKNTNSLLLCLPPKTADNTLMFTFDELCNHQRGEIVYENIWHKTHLFRELFDQSTSCNIKIITAVREPIAQNLSMLYETVSAASERHIMRILLALENATKSDYERVLAELENIYLEHGDDMQVLFDDCVMNDVYPILTNIRVPLRSFFIQPFMELFCEDILNVYEHPFNKEKGYAIMKQGNVEVFIYQLEKMNDIIPEFSEWLGVPFDAWVRGNEASDKWIGDSYKQAQKEIEITQEYFDRCFNEPYVKHCYSEADIEKFKARWRPHIKPGK